MVRNNTITRVFDSKATILTAANSDHKPVITKMVINGNINQKLKAERNVSTYMKNQNIRNCSQNEIKSYLIDNHDQPSNNQNSLEQNYQNVEIAAENTIGYVNKS